MILYLTDEETAVLDASGFVLRGSGDGESYSFSGESTDVEYPPADIIIDSDHDGIDDSIDPMIDADMDGLEDDFNDDLVDVDGDTLDDRFEDDLVDANSDGEDDRIVETFADLRNINTISADVDFTLDGEVIIGDSTTSTTTECKGSACPPNIKTYKCTRTQTFEGVEIEDADVSVEAPTQ